MKAGKILLVGGTDGARIIPLVNAGGEIVTVVTRNFGRLYCDCAEYRGNESIALILIDWRTIDYHAQENIDNLLANLQNIHLGIPILAIHK